ncbi:V8-like Glu-specific endopeptidase [Thermomonospora echinospora]|uniref:V8-like Glu-specific endopeptidase n=2 Tax=Thermomonospora echinospora TaxID=1992 RepID=A0A1H6D4A8_9ACTN|nr:V8-like Glu-specific endopeptidase [Thermomonospora echinospora]
MRLWVALGSGCGVVAATVGAMAFTGDDEPVAQVRQAADSGVISATAARSVESYWTPERMAKATPVDGRTATSGGVTTTAAARTAQAYGGIPSVGALFFNNGSGDRYCTGAVINSTSQRLVITAAHCIHGGMGRTYYKNVAFVPKYDRGKKPYGIWTARKLFVHRLWANRSDADLDYGFISLHAKDGRLIQQRVGGNPLAIDQGYRNTVNVTGYPKIKFDSRDRPIWCRTGTAKYARYQVRLECNGFYGGVSGSPWLLKYNSKTKKGYINGVIGGYRGGGSVHWVSYTSYFDKDVANLRKYASNNA